MNVLASTPLLLIILFFNGLAESVGTSRLPSGNSKAPRCERYTGKVCAKYVQNRSIFVKSRTQNQNEITLKLVFKVIPPYLSKLCNQYAFKALCLIVFPPCDQTVNYPKPRTFCRDECKAFERHICANELSRGHTMANLMPRCSSLPAVNSTAYKKCIRLDVKIYQPVFKQKLKNVTAEVGEKVVLKCKTKSTKIVPTFTWYKDGKIIQDGHQVYKVFLLRYHSRMKIRRLKLSDSGRYKCVVSNAHSNVSSESWITVVRNTKPRVNTTVFPEKKNTSSCGYLKPSSICSPYLKEKLVYFHDSKKQSESEVLIGKAIEKSKVSSQCFKYATAAMCYHMFPSCGNGATVKHRLCKEDCLKVKTEICQKTEIPNIFPECSGLPKSGSNKGKHCKKINLNEGSNTKKQHPRCEKYKGNNFCGKYLQNQTVYFDDMQRQYNTERLFSVSVEGNIYISEKCLKFGVPGICYHLFPVCHNGKRKSRLCKEDCLKLKTNACSDEISHIKRLSDMQYVDKMFPECSRLPRAGTKDGRFCMKITVPNNVDLKGNSSGGVVKLYVSSHKCYNGTGIDYLGTRNTTVFGVACINWNIARPATTLSHNYCRNPKAIGKSPWCYVNSTGRKEYCGVPKCGSLVNALTSSGVESTSLGRTIYVVIAIVAVILLGCVTVVAYWKVQNSKENPDASPQGSAAHFAKSSSQLADTKENTEIKSFIMNEKMSRGKVKYVSVLGEGSFCQVYKGELINDQGDSNMNIVIKALDEDTSAIEREAFVRETSLLCPLQHVNILGLLGVSPHEDKEFVVFEYLSEMNLHQFLKLKSPPNNCDESQYPSTYVLLNIAAQIANGMKYLTEFNYIHGDLAARNCFIAENEVAVKISMLGIGSHKYPSDYGWLHQGNSLYPIRWMSPETLESLVLTSENDVWAFGVVLWEIFSLGLKPYHQYSNTEVTDKVRSLELLECSLDWSRSVRSLINDCWSVAPSTRPNFETIHETLCNDYITMASNALEVAV